MQTLNKKKIAILMSNWADFKAKSIVRDKEEHFFSVDQQPYIHKMTKIKEESKREYCKMKILMHSEWA